ncbi:STY4526/YPO1902 family pathogenicity island replication protein, partial [Acinetobacter baumannii]
MLIAQWDLDIQVGFGDGSISASLDRVHAIRRDTELAEYFVRNGASTELMVTLFRSARDDVRALRKALAVEASEAVGRPKLPPIEKREL